MTDVTRWINVYRDYGQVWYSQDHSSLEKAIFGAALRKPIYRIKITLKAPK
jgi:hypothetical protein